MENKQFILGLFFDLSKAFDLVDHLVLLEKLHLCGIRGNAYNWIKSYLTSRPQQVVLNGVKSETMLNNSGVPQCSILGPLLSLIYLNDLPNNCKTASKAVIYADDTSLLVSSEQRDRQLSLSQSSIEELQHCCNLNGLLLNRPKSNFIDFRTKNSVINKIWLLRVDGASLKHAEETNAEIPHTNSLKEKLNSYCFLVRTLKSTVTIDVLKLVYFSIVQSALSYGLIYWGLSSEIESVFSLQKKIIRIMAGFSFRQHCKPAFIKLQLLTLPCLYIFHVALYTRNNLNNYSQNQDIHNYNTRTKTDLNIPFHRLSLE